MLPVVGLYERLLVRKFLRIKDILFKTCLC